MQDADEAGYFYNDLLPAVLNTAEKKVAEEIKAEQQKNTSKDSQTDTDSSQPADYDVYYFPSSYRRAVKYGQRDAANEILRTEVLAQIAARQQHTTHEKPLFVVTYPEAMAELVVSQKHIDDHRLSLSVGQRIDIVEVEPSMSIPIPASCRSVSTSLATRSTPSGLSPLRTSFPRSGARKWKLCRNWQRKLPRRYLFFVSFPTTPSSSAVT